jgi:RNA 3'-terminal phosphate cyclase (ATP)
MLGAKSAERWHHKAFAGERPAMHLLYIDGSYGEGGGQILRSALTLSALTGRAFCLENIRARRRNPGLAAQHLTAVQSAAEICAARVEGASLGSARLEFAPREPVRAGRYTFDVAAVRQGGSAGSTLLVVQTLLLPLALAPGDSHLTLHGGTHVSFSPPFDYVEEVWLPMLARMGFQAEIELRRCGWYPVGRGEIHLRVRGRGDPRTLTPLSLDPRGRLLRVTGRALTSRLPEHVSERMASRATALLRAEGIAAAIEPVGLEAACPGAGLFLTAHYETVRAGFNALGERGKPAETVAEEAVVALLSHVRSGAACEVHLADQLVLPAALCPGTSRYRVERVSQHLETCAWVVERFGFGPITITREPDGSGTVAITGTDLSRGGSHARA